MFDDLDEALRALLKRELPVKNGEVDIEFKQPRREWSARLSRPTIDLFLFDVREDTKRRATMPPWRPDQVDERNSVSRRRPLHVLLHYALTAWANEPEDEHRLLARALLALYRFPQMPAELLPEGLREQPAPINLEVAQAEGLINPSDFWSAMDNEIRPLLFCSVSMAIEPSFTVTAPIIKTRDLRFIDVSTGETEGPGRVLWTVRGTVRGLPPLRPAKLALVECEQEVDIGYQGDYVVTGVPEGEYTVQVTPAGAAATRHRLTVPAKSYDVQVAGPTTGSKEVTGPGQQASEEAPPAGARPPARAEGEPREPGAGRKKKAGA